ncbi:MAG: hypothetical protein ACYTGH_11905, partial [Planctomycetota bacterium]
MTLRHALEEENRAFLTQHLQTLQGLMHNAAEFGLEEMTRELSVKQLINIGRILTSKNESGVHLDDIPSYSDTDSALVSNLYPFLERVYLRAMGKSGALAKHKEVAELTESLEEEKRQRFKDLSQSTVTNLEEIMNEDMKLLSAKSQQQVEKKSYTNVREVAKSAETTHKKLKELAKEKKVDASGIYRKLEQTRMELDATERAQNRILERTVGKALEYLEGFDKVFREVMSTVATTSFGRLPDVDRVEDLPLVDKAELERVYGAVLAADRTVMPQGSLDREDPFRVPQLVLVPATGYMIAATGLTVEAFRENVIFVPMRCLEPLVKGLARELLRFKRKTHARVA